MRRVLAGWRLNVTVVLAISFCLGQIVRVIVQILTIKILLITHVRLVIQLVITVMDRVIKIAQLV